jgi:AraC-like DNA-binding protein/CheY-like chemotaxis protein
MCRSAAARLGLYWEPASDPGRVKHPLLWLDMTVSSQDHDTSNAFAKHFEIRRFAPIESIRAHAEHFSPAVAVFDFDFPTRRGLNLLRDTKRALPSLPLLMLTVQHSEQLAVWAFRTRVWDYIVKPLSKIEIDRCLCSLEELLLVRSTSTPPRTAAMPGASIPMEHRADGHHSREPAALAPAISYVEQNFRNKVVSTHAAALCGLSSFQFSRAFKEAYSLTFQEYVLRFRIREACRLLRDPTAQVGDVSMLVGFNDPSYFCKTFKRFLNVSPSQFGQVSEAQGDPAKLLSLTEAH